MTTPSPSHLAARVFGTPGAGLAAARGIAPSLVRVGIAGERLLASHTLAALQRNLSMALFFSLKPPGQRGDVDQLLWAGGQFWLMDAKHWKGSEHGRTLWYEITSREGDQLHFHRNGAPFKGGTVSTPKQLDLWRRYLSPHLVTSVIVLTNPEAGVRLGTSNRRTLVLSAGDLPRWLAGFRADGPPLEQVWMDELARRAFEMPAAGAARSARPVAPPVVVPPPVPMSRPLASTAASARVAAPTHAGSHLSPAVEWLVLAAALLGWAVPSVGGVPALISVCTASVLLKRRNRLGRRSRLLTTALIIGWPALVVNLAMHATAIALTIQGFTPYG